MPEKSRRSDKRPPGEITTDFLGEDRHEFVAKLAYELWERRGRPFGSPEVDWFAAEQTVYASLASSGLVVASSGPRQNTAQQIYR